MIVFLSGMFDRRLVRIFFRQPCYVCNATGQACGAVKTGDGDSVPGPGAADADFVLYVSAVDTERCKRGLTVAYAAHCQQESALDR